MHMKVHSEEKPCQYTLWHVFSQNTSHKFIYLHSVEEPNQCSFWVMAFSGSNDLVRHMMLHNEENPINVVIVTMFLWEKSDTRSYKKTY